VTQLNLRNLLFGRFLPDEEGKFTFAEVQGFDQFEKVVQTKVKDKMNSSKKQFVNILPIRYILNLSIFFMLIFNDSYPLDTLWSWFHTSTE